MRELVVDYGDFSKFQIYEVSGISCRTLFGSPNFGNLMHDLRNYFKDPSTMDQDYQLKITDSAFDHFSPEADLEKTRSEFMRIGLDFLEFNVHDNNLYRKALLEGFITTHKEYTGDYLC